MGDIEAEEAEMEEVEDLLEYYMQRAATTQSEAERLLAGARDLEESISLSLSARRFEARALHAVDPRNHLLILRLSEERPACATWKSHHRVDHH
jgi:hypothetical protein